MNKYHAKRTEAHGFTFDSKKEAARYGDLLLLQRAGEISSLDRQVKYPLNIHGEHICDYVCDFQYYEKVRDKKRLVVEDVKSTVTRKLPVYLIKKRLMRAIYGLEIRET